MDELDELEVRIPEFLTDPQGVIRRRWPWMLAVFLVTSIAAAVFVATLPQTYEADGRLLLARQRIPEDFVRPTSMEGVPDLVDAVVGEILSRDSLVEVAETTNLPERTPTDGTMSDLIDEMRDAITVEPDMDVEGPRSRYGASEEIFILAIRFESSDPVVAADVANELVSRFVDSHRRRQTRKAKLTTDFLRQEAEQAEAELAQQRARITDFTEAHRGELPSELDTKLARLDRLQQQSQSLALGISDAEGRLLVLQKPGPEAEETLLEELRARLIEERTVYTDEHPNVIALQRQIEALEAEAASRPSRGLVPRGSRGSSGCRGAARGGGAASAGGGGRAADPRARRRRQRDSRPRGGAAGARAGGGAPPRALHRGIQEGPGRGAGRESAARGARSSGLPARRGDRTRHPDAYTLEVRRPGRGRSAGRLGIHRTAARVRGPGHPDSRQLETQAGIAPLGVIPKIR